MLAGGASWAVAQGFGEARDLERIEEEGRMAGARPECVSSRAKERQRREMGTLGSGNHYLEIQAVAEIYDPAVAGVFGLARDDVVATIHCGSRGLGHQIGTEFLKEMVVTAKESGIELPDRELACAPIDSEVGQRYLGAMRAAINCALANREILGHYTRQIFAHFFPNCDLRLLFDVSHNTCKVEPHAVDRKRRDLFVHRKGATRAFGPGHEVCRRRCVLSASRCSSAAAWEQVHTFLSAKRRANTRRSPRPVTAPVAHYRATRRSSNGAAAR